MDVNWETTARRILVIDDSAVSRQLFRKQLQDEELEVIEAEDAEAGFRQAVEFQPSLIFLDVEMPGPDGFDAIRMLKEDARTRSIPVVFYSIHASTEMKARGLDLGAVDFLAKPTDSVELRARVRAALRSKSQFDLLEQRAHVDGLTGLANRIALEERLIEEWWTCLRRGTSLAVLIADLDHFKAINDRYGHAAGDIILQATAHAFREVVRVGDFVARFGGEEFVAIAPDCNLEGALLIADRLRQVISELEVTSRGKRVAITASVGVAVAPAEGVSEIFPREILRRADEALYQAKAAGRNAVRNWDAVPYLSA